MTARLLVLLVCVGMVGCERAPSVDILGSYFPGWLVCLAASVLLTVLTRWILLRLEIDVTAPVVVYPSLTATFTFAQWLIWLR
jgi:YtcA family